MMRRRRTQVVDGRYFGPTTPPGRVEPTDRLDPPPAELAKFTGSWRAPLKTPAELEAAALAEDARRRAALGELLLGIPGRDERRELLTWALRRFVDAPTAPDPKPEETP